MLMMEINCRCFKLKLLDKHVISRGQSKLLIQQNVKCINIQLNISGRDLGSSKDQPKRSLS